MSKGHPAAELRKLAECRLAEAEALLAAGEWSGARYLAGYAIELGLKSKAAKDFRRSHMPDQKTVNNLYTHRLADLMGYAGVKQQLNARVKVDSGFAANWGIASKWSEQDRYKTWTKAEAKSMVAAVGDPNDGILPWIKTHL